MKPERTCSMNVNYLKMIVAVAVAVFFGSMSVHASDIGTVSQVSGEITWIDLKLGKLQLQSDAFSGTGEITEYRISQNETRVTNPTDSKFLAIADLQPGQHIKLDVINGKEGKIVQKITADPRPTSNLQEAYGEIEAIDASAGTITLVRRSRAGEMGESNLSSFVFEPQDVIVMQSPSRQPVQLQLKPSDLVKVEFVVKDQKRQAQYITLYSPRATSTTTTTVTTVTQ